MSTPSQPNRNLVYSLGDAVCFGGMVGCGETYLPAFALAVGLGETSAGLVSSLPIFAGGLLQMVAPRAIHLLGSLRTWIVLGAAIQAFSFLPLIFAAFTGSISLPVLLLVVSVYWAAGMATGPAWNTWMSQLVKKETRPRFFASRTRAQKISTLFGLLAAGLILHQLEDSQVGTGFVFIFGLATLLRILSATFLRLQDDVRHDQIRDDYLDHASAASMATPTSKAMPPTAKRLLLYLILVQASVNVCGPYFVPFMLEQLDFSYTQYITLISLAFLSKVLSLKYWGQFAERHGPQRLLWIGGIGLVPLSSLWVVSPNIWWLAFIQIVSGIAWAAYELGFLLGFFETIPSSKQTRLLTIYNVANSAAICAGAAAGWLVLKAWGCSSTTYFGLFIASSICRLACLAVLTGVHLRAVPLKRLAVRILSVRPGAASIVAPVVASRQEDSTTQPTK